MSFILMKFFFILWFKEINVVVFMFKFVGVYMDSDCVKCFFVYRGCVGIIDLG